MNKAFSPIIIIILVAVFLGLGGGVWYFWTKTKSLSPIVWLENFSQSQQKNESNCTDSDGGKNYYVKGETADFGDTRKDVCFDSNTLTEFYCEQATGQTRPSRTAEQRKCEYGCKDGACVEETVVPVEETVVPSDVAAQFDELKRKYEDKKWRGTLKGKMTAAIPGMSCTQTYTARIDKMWINFNASETGSYISMGPGRRMSIDGNAVLESAHISCTCAEINVEISSFPFKLDGVIDFSEGTINFNAEDPEADKGFKALYITTCEPGMEPFYGDDEVLFSIFDPHMAAFKFERDKIILTAESGNLSGLLSPF